MMEKIFLATWLTFQKKSYLQAAYFLLNMIHFKPKLYEYAYEYELDTIKKYIWIYQIKPPIGYIDNRYEQCLWEGMQLRCRRIRIGHGFIFQQGHATR